MQRTCGTERCESYLHGLDGLVSVLHRADLIVHGLVWQQQLVEDLQRPGPVADRFQRHDRQNEVGWWGEEHGRTGFGAAARTRTHTSTRTQTLSDTHTLTLSPSVPLIHVEVTAAWLSAVHGGVSNGKKGKMEQEEDKGRGGEGVKEEKVCCVVWEDEKGEE